MRAMDQRSHDQKTPSSLRQIEVPDRIPTYEESRAMSRKLTAYFIRKGIQQDHRDFWWRAGLVAIRQKKFEKSVDKHSSTHDV
jgi:hypothetical protein